MKIYVVCNQQETVFHTSEWTSTRDVKAAHHMTWHDAIEVMDKRNKQDRMGAGWTVRVHRLKPIERY